MSAKRMKVKIKTWKVLVEEYGLTADGDIYCARPFTPYMEILLPENRIIKGGKTLESYFWKLNKDSSFYATNEVIENIMPSYAVHDEKTPGCPILKIVINDGYLIWQNLW